MTPAAKEKFLLFNQQFESLRFEMYLDQLGLVTTGVGQKIDADGTGHPEAPAYVIPWYTTKPKILNPNAVQENPVDDVAICNEWRRVKAAQRWASSADRMNFFASTATLWTSLDALTLLASKQLLYNESIVRHYLPDWDVIGDAPQLAISSIMWAVGATRFCATFPKLIQAVTVREWEDAARECFLNHPPGLYTRRNAATAALFKNCIGLNTEIPDPLSNGNP